MVTTVPSGTSQPLTLLGIQVSKSSPPYKPASHFLGNKVLGPCLPYNYVLFLPAGPPLLFYWGLG